MSRVFSQHEIRNVQSLDGIWGLYVPKAGTQIDPFEWQSGMPYSFAVPSVWESIPELVNYRGQAVARRTFTVPRAGAVRLVFKGVAHWARVYVDGAEVGDHYDAYTPFAVDLPVLPAGEHELLVHISNEFGGDSALHVENDYYSYGGINRPVELQLLKDPIYIRFVHFTPRWSEEKWSASLEVQVVNYGKPLFATLRVTIAGVTHEFTRVAFEPGETALQAEMQFDNIEPWTPETPRLYMIDAQLRHGNNVIDDWRDRTGFRTVTTQGEQILLNGKPIFLAGFNRHEDHALFGNALPLQVQHHDAVLMKQLGANAVRTSHYPNDERFLDIADELGLMVWEENHARGLALLQMRHPRFREQCRDCIDAMIAWHYNHPSIVIWGILNECASDLPEGRAIYEEQFEQIRRLDRSRLTTFASCRHKKDLCQDLPDVLGWNWYYNWYGRVPVAEGLPPDLDYIDAHGGKEKPIIASEFGAGGIPGFHDPFRRAKWSEERQADILRECLDVYLNHPRLAGAFIWQFCDVRVHESWAMGRPRCINDKGVVDGERRPKLAVEVVRELFKRSWRD